MGEERLKAPLQESLAVAVKLKTRRAARGGGRHHGVGEGHHLPDDRARVRLVRLSKRHGLRLRQSRTRLGERARQFRRAKRQLRRLKAYLGRVTRDVERKIAGRPELNAALRRELFRAGRVLLQERHQRGRKIYSLHAPEVECIGKGKAHKPYEFGVKVSIATPVRRSRGG